jgi:hypothetical protein
MISIRRGAVDAPQSFTDRTLSSANFDMTAVRRDKNVNEALHLIMLEEKQVGDNGRLSRENETQCQAGQ